MYANADVNNHSVYGKCVWSKTSPQTSMYISGNFITVNLPKSVLFLVDSLENGVRN